MVTFWISSAALVILALAIIAPALLRSRGLVDYDRNRQNVQIARERIAELEAERDEGVLNAEEFEQAKREVESALLIDVDQTEEKQTQQLSGVGKGTFIAIAVLVPLLAVLIYLQIGDPEMIEFDPATAQADQQQGGDLGSVEEMIDRLVERLEQNPEDAEGWFMLGRTMMVMQEYEKAVTAFENAHKLLPDEPSVKLALADALAMKNKGDMGGRTKELVEQALTLEPDNATGLWMAGMIAESEGQYSEALEFWLRLRPSLAGELEDLQQLDQLIERVKGKMDPEAAAAVKLPAAAEKADVGKGKGVRVRVTVDAELASRADSGDVVYVYARAIDGPRFPLSAARYRVSDLPLDIVLDDSGAVMSNAKLSDFAQVTIGARISKSGDAMSRSGDLRGEVSPVAVGGEQPVAIVIDSVVP